MTLQVSHSNSYSEDALVEQPTIALFDSMQWETANLYHETFGKLGSEGRETDHEVVLTRRLRGALEKLNPSLPDEAYSQAVDELTRDRSAMSNEAANREVYQLLKDGIRVTLPDEQGGQTVETLQAIDWRRPENNEFFLASQFWISGDMYRRRCDLVGFVNGLPLVFIELKAAHKALKNAYDQNLRDYRLTIPQLFVYNALIIISNGSQTQLGSISAAWEHFFEWKRINDEGEKGVVSLETAIRGTCDKTRLLDLVENFTLFEEARGGLIKKVAKNHQYLGVNRSIEAVKALGTNQGRLGVFWHTQGSGKSLSMAFFTQKILRTIPGNWTFLVVTDRDELDGQIYKTFTAVGAVTETEAQASSAANLKQLLKEDHRYVFTLIQKFRTKDGAPYPKLSDRSDIIVITDEAHRSQYDVFALNMRKALPNAAFIGFTGTPLMVGEEKTREVFGEYVSVYNFAQSIQDGATVPLYYENRIPELQLTNQDLNADMEQLLEDAELDEEQEKKLEREFAREYHLITREERLEKIAEDLVTHFVSRGHKGKAMMVCIDKATAVRMYDKVKAYWARHLKELKGKFASSKGTEREILEAKLAEMESTDMAVVVSQSQNEIPDMAAKGLDIVPHRKRMVSEDLEEQFKDPDNPLRLVFVCAMWITGFDVPSCSTLYLDKPMKNHTLMQTIARANRVAPGKTAGLIVDYVGVFRSLQKALAIYAAPTVEGEGSDTPIKDKSALVECLKQALAEADAYCLARGVALANIEAAEGFARIGLLDDAVEALIKSDEEKKQFMLLANQAARLYKAILPDPQASQFAPRAVLLFVISDKIRALTPPADISEVLSEVETLLNESIATEGYVIHSPSADSDTSTSLIDLSTIDFKALQAKFSAGHKRTEAEKLRSLINQKLISMVKLNRSRTDYLERFQRLIDEYNAGSKNIETFFEELKKFAQDLSEEDQRAVAKGLNEEELAIFDLLTRPEPKLTKKEEAEVKKVARALLETLKREKLVLDWRARQQSRAAVRQAIEITLDNLPEVYTTDIYERKCDLAYHHVYDNYYGQGQSVYQEAVAQ
jgi:type I restriction enzyme R subunit